MTKEQVIEQINNLPFIKDANITVNRIKFDSNKEGNHRFIWVYFNKQKYACGVVIIGKYFKYTQTEPTFVPGVGENDKDYWSEEVRRKLCHWLFCRFWIWIKRVDMMYDSYVNGNWGKNSLMTTEDKWELPIFTGLIHDGWSIQKHLLKHLFKLPNLKDMYDWYNDDVKDNLYKNFGYIEYGNETYKELTTEEEFKSVRIGF